MVISSEAKKIRRTLRQALGTTRRSRKSLFKSKYKYRQSRARAIKARKSAYPLYASLPGFLKQTVVNMPYHMEFTTSSSSITYNTFNSNDIYDPDYTGSGHQPRSHDQYALYYKYYRVTKCKFKAIFFWEETPSQSHAVGVYIDDNGTFAYSSTLDLYEKEGMKYSKILQSDRTSTVTIVRNIPMTSMTAGALKDQRTTFGSAPTLKAPYIHVWTVPNNTTALSYGAVRVHIEMIFTVNVFEPIDIGGS